MQNENYDRTFYSRYGKAQINIFWDADNDPGNPGLVYMVRADGEDCESGPIEDLSDLLSVLRSWDVQVDADLPTFGGEEPDDTYRVFSWDADNLLRFDSGWYIEERGPLTDVAAVAREVNACS